MAVTNVLITGSPGVGKTTLIKRLVSMLEWWAPVGFYTEEIREGGRRTGFRIVDLASDRRAVLSSVKIKSPRKVGRYGVDVEGFERFLGESGLLGVAGEAGAERPRVVVIDEIGKMECFSRVFVSAVQDLFDSALPVVATVARSGGGFISGVRNRGDVTVFEVTRANRDGLATEIFEYLRKECCL